MTMAPRMVHVDMEHIERLVYRTLVLVRGLAAERQRSADDLLICLREASRWTRAALREMDEALRLVDGQHPVPDTVDVPTPNLRKL